MKSVKVNGNEVKIAAPDEELVPYMVGMALAQHYGKKWRTMTFEAVVEAGGKKYSAKCVGRGAKITLML